LSPGGFTISTDKVWTNATAAKITAEKALRAQNLIGEAAANAAREGHPGQPLLVERLDEVGVGYYLIPWNTSRGTEIIVRVDASIGEFLGFAQFSQPSMSPFISAQDALRRAQAKVPGVQLGSPRCVWRPCRQSTTPVRPFYEFPFDGKTLYVDMDGMVHRRLTSLGRGG